MNSKRQVSRGSISIEYALIAALMSLAVLCAMFALQNGTGVLYDRMVAVVRYASDGIDRLRGINDDGRGPKEGKCETCEVWANAPTRLDSEQDAQYNASWIESIDQGVISGRGYYNGVPTADNQGDWYAIGTNGLLPDDKVTLLHGKWVPKVFPNADDVVVNTGFNRPFPDEDKAFIYDFDGGVTYGMTSNGRFFRRAGPKVQPVRQFISAGVIKPARQIFKTARNDLTNYDALGNRYAFVPKTGRQGVLGASEDMNTPVPKNRKEKGRKSRNHHWYQRSDELGNRETLVYMSDRKAVDGTMCIRISGISILR